MQNLKMERNRLKICLLAVAMIVVLVPLSWATEKEKSTEEQMAGLQTMCTKSADARAERHLNKPLYDRLGGYDKILELTTEVVRLHSINPDIKWTLKGVDHALLAKHVADFIATGTGGTAKYTGRNLPASHARLNLTDADFLAAGGDIVKAMQTMKYGQEEIDEFVCILVSLKDQVVFK